jgi:hypothetical protein
MSHADLTDDREDLLKIQAMLRRRINDLALQLARLEVDLDLVDRKLEATR